MRKLIAAIAFLFLSTFAFGQTTAVVTGNLVDQSETGTSSGISVDVTLVNTGSQRCFVSGTGTFVKEKTNYTAAQVLAGITLAKNGSITCGATTGQSRWRFTFKNAALNTSRDCDLQISGATSLNTATCLQAATTPTTTVPTSSLFLLLDGSNSMTGNLVPAVNGTQSIGTSGARWNIFSAASDISGNATVGGTLGVTGNVTETAGQNQYKAFLMNGVRWVDGIKYTTIAGCYADLSAGQTCMVPPGYTETLAANIVLNKKKTTIQFMGSCAITLGAFNIQVAQGTDDVSIISPFAHSSDQGGNNQGCMMVGYTGSAAAIDVGSSAGFTYNALIRGIAVDLFSAQANAIAYRLTNGVQDVLDDDTCVEGPVSGQKCFNTVGTGAFFAGLNRILSPECTAAAGATNNFCIQLGTISNDNTIIGGHANILGSGANNSVCIDVSGSTSGNNQLYGFDCDTGVTAITIESTVSRGIYAVINVDSGVTNGANFAASSIGNTVIINANLPVTDNGVAGTNSYINPARFGWRTDKLQWQVESGFALLVNASTTAPFDVWIYSGDRRVNADTGANQVKLAWDQGTGGVAFGNGASAQVAAIDSSGRLTLKEAAAPSGSSGNDLLWADSSDHMAKYNPNNGGEQHMPQIYMLTAQYTNSTTGFTTVGTPNIAFPVNANQKYTAECHLYYQAAATGGLNIQFTGPAAPTNVVYGLNDPISATTFGGDSVATAFSTSLGSAVTTAATNFDAQVSFSLINGANAGTVTLQAKSSAAVQLQIQAGSFCQVQ